MILVQCGPFKCTLAVFPEYHQDIIQSFHSIFVWCKIASLKKDVAGLRYFCQIGKLSKNLKAKNRKIVKKNLLNFRGHSHTGKLSKKVHSHTRKLSKKNYGSQPYRKIVKLHFEMIFCRKTHLKLGVIYEVRHIKGMAIHDICQLGNQEKIGKLSKYIISSWPYRKIVKKVHSHTGKLSKGFTAT